MRSKLNTFTGIVPNTDGEHEAWFAIGDAPYELVLSLTVAGGNPIKWRNELTGVNKNIELGWNYRIYGHRVGGSSDFPLAEYKAQYSDQKMWVE